MIAPLLEKFIGSEAVAPTNHDSSGERSGPHHPKCQTRAAGTFWRAAQQCFFGSIALAIVTIFCFRVGANLPTTAFIYLAVIVLLFLIGSYFASVVFTILSVAAASGRREMAPKPGLAAAANSSIMASEPIGEWA